MNLAAVISIIIFIFLIIGYGIYPNVKGSIRESFLISNRDLGFLNSGTTIAATKVGGGLLVTYSTVFFVYGLASVSVFFGYVLGYICFYFFVKNVIWPSYENNEKKYYTISDYFETEHGYWAGKLAGLLTAISLFGWVLTNSVAGGQLLASIADLSNPAYASVGLLILITGYLWAGGFQSVVKTDVIQYVALILLMAIIAIAIIGGDITGTKLPSVKEGWISQSILFLVIGVVFPFGSAELWQRVYATRDLKSFRNASVFASLSFFVLGIALSALCAAVINLSGDYTPETRLPLGVADLLENGWLSALWLIAFASAIMSSADTFLYTTASALGQDLKILGTSLDDFDQARWSIIIVSLIAILISLFSPSVEEVTYFFLAVTLSISGTVLFNGYDKLNDIQVAAQFALPIVIGTLYILWTGSLTPATAAVTLIASLLIGLGASVWNNWEKQQSSHHA